MRFPAQRARLVIIVASLLLSGSLLIFLTVAPYIGFAFNERSNENIRLIEIATPLFFGYLGSAAHFVFNPTGGRSVPRENEGILAFIVVGPFVVFSLFITAMFVVFFISHSPEAQGPALSFDLLSRGFSIGLALLAATVSVASAYLFGAPPGRYRSSSSTDKAAGQ